MAKWGDFDYSEFEKFAKNLQKGLGKDAVGEFIRDFLLEMAMRALRKIKKRTPVATGKLREKWSVGKVVKSGSNYEVEIFNNIEYASFVEYGFRSHFVPGRWEGNEFVYDRSANTGMYVGPKDGWVEGRFMMTISMKEIEREFPIYLGRRVTALMMDLFGGKG